MVKFSKKKKKKNLLRFTYNSYNSEITILCPFILL